MSGTKGEGSGNPSGGNPSAGSGDVLPGGRNKSGNPNVEGQRDKRGLVASAECCETAIVYDLSTVRSCDTERSRISRHCCAASRAKREQGSGLQDPRELQKEFGNLEFKSLDKRALQGASRS